MRVERSTGYLEGVKPCARFLHHARFSRSSSGECAGDVQLPEPGETLRGGRLSASLFRGHSRRPRPLGEPRGESKQLNVSGVAQVKLCHMSACFLAKRLVQARVELPVETDFF